MTQKSYNAKQYVENNRKGFIMEGISSVCALASSVVALIMVVFQKWISIKIFKTENVTVFELPDIIDSYRRTIESFNFGNGTEIEKKFADLDFATTLFAGLSVVIAIMLLLHIVFLVFGKGKWLKSTIITITVLYGVLITSFGIFADKVNEAVSKINLIFVSLSDVLFVENSVIYTFIALSIGVVSSFVYAHYKNKN